MSEFNPTTDQPWVYEEDSFGSQVIYTGEKEEGKWIAQIRGWGWIQKLDDAEKRQDDNGKLIADAGNTYHATGMTPSQLAERVKVLEDALRAIVKDEVVVYDEFDGCDCIVSMDTHDMISVAEKALTK